MSIKLTLMNIFYSEEGGYPENPFNITWLEVWNEFTLYLDYHIWLKTGLSLRKDL